MLCDEKIKKIKIKNYENYINNELKLQHNSSKKSNFIKKLI